MSFVYSQGAQQSLFREKMFDCWKGEVWEAVSLESLVN